jgi:hypothetical protein
VVAIALIVPGCSAINKATGNDIERADDLGLPLPGIPAVVQPASGSATNAGGTLPGTSLPVVQPASGSATNAGGTLPGTSLPTKVGDYDDIYRNAFVEQWMARSDYLCRQYKDKIIRTARDWKLGTDVLTTVLAGLATIFTPVGTIRPLAGAATIVTGSGSALQSDVFSQQAGDLIASAIQTARENQANQIEHNLSSADSKVYSIYRAQRDVIEYHNMCSLETALKTIRASLQATSPDAGRTPPAAQGSQTPGGVVAPEVQKIRSLPGAKDFSINKPSDALTPHIPLPPTTLQPHGRTDYERRLSPEIVKKMQLALCVKPADGILGDATRVAAQDYQLGRARKGSTDGSVDVDVDTSVRAAIDMVGSCSEKGFHSAYEVGRYGVSSDPKGDIQELQQWLKAAGGRDVPDTGELDDQTRKAISQVSPGSDGTVDAVLISKLHPKPPPRKPAP